MILTLLRDIIEIITGKNCYKCKHCIGNVSCDNLQRYMKCVSSIYPNGFERRDKGGAE